MQKHEKIILGYINSRKDENWTNIKEYHKVQIEFLQHERLVHLMVTLAFAAFSITSYIITGFLTTVPMILLDLILTTMLIFYIVHYYRLENGIQRWYDLYNRICEKNL